MIKKVVKKYRIEDLAYWLSKSSEERISAVEILRRQYHGNTARLQRSARVIQLIQPDRSKP
jgi:hypothetical protein